MENEYDINTNIENNIHRQEEINKRFESLPKGHVNILKRNGKGYYYLTYREGKKIKNDYLGPVGKADLNDIFAKLREREELSKELKALKLEEKKRNKQLKKQNGISKE